MNTQPRDTKGRFVKKPCIPLAFHRVPVTPLLKGEFGCIDRVVFDSPATMKNGDVLRMKTDLCYGLISACVVKK